MVFRIAPRFLECRDCRFYSPRRLLGVCLRCGAGEFFEERQDDREPTDDELMTYYRKMDRQNDDEES